MHIWHENDVHLTFASHRAVNAWPGRHSASLPSCKMSLTDSYFGNSRVTENRMPQDGATESTYNWTTQRWTVPVIAGASQLLKLGSQPISLGLSGKYTAEH